MVQIPSVKIHIGQVQNHGAHTKERTRPDDEIKNHARMKKTNIIMGGQSPCGHDT